MAYNINGHTSLEEKHVFRVEMTECCTQTHSGHSVNQLV